MKIQFRIPNKKINPTSLHGKERIPYEKIQLRFNSLGWESSIEYDENWNWYILAGKNNPELGYIIRRIRPYKIKSPQDLYSAVKFQEKFKSDLLEVFPYKFYKGDRLFFPNSTEEFDFMTEAKFQLFSKFFKTYDFSLKEVDKNEAKENNNGL